MTQMKAAGLAYKKISTIANADPIWLNYCSAEIIYNLLNETWTFESKKLIIIKLNALFLEEIAMKVMLLIWAWKLLKY